MAKFTSIILLATAAALASFSAAAPVPSTTTTTAAAAAPTTETVHVAGSTTVHEFDTSKTYNGKATWFEDSMGACGDTWDGESERVVALNEHQMGAASNNNPVCGKRVQITNTANGKTVTGRILDKCPGGECAYGSLDLSPAAFRAIGDQSTGIIPIAWHYL